jgi:hypothetical protein
MDSRRFVLAAALLCPACGKPPAAPSREPRFAIELPGHPPSHILVFDGGGSANQLPFSSLTEDSGEYDCWPSSPVAPTIRHLNLICCKVQHKVQHKVHKLYSPAHS